MSDFLQYGKTPEGRTTVAPLDLDPRGKTSFQVHEIIRQETAQKEAQEQYWKDLAEEKDWSKWGYFEEAIGQESMVVNLFGIAEDFIEDYDPEFDPTPFIEENWPAWRKSAVMDAKNERHAQLLIERTQAQHDHNLHGEYHGGVSMALDMAGALVNPETMVLGIGEAATLTKLGLSGGRKVMAGMAIGALSNTAQEGVIIANNKSRDKLGLVTAAAFGAGFGAFGSMFSPKDIDADQAATKALGKSLSGAWEHDLKIATGDVKVAPSTTRCLSPGAQVWESAVDAGEAAIDPVNGKYTVLFGKTAQQYDTKAQAVAAARLRKKLDIAPTDAEIKTQIDADYEALASEYAKLTQRKGGKWSSIGLEGRSSENPFTRYLHYQLTEDASGTGGKEVATHSGALRADRYANHLRSIWHTARHEHSKVWARENGKAGLKRYLPWDNSHMARFDDEVVKEVAFRRNPSTRPKGIEAHPSIKAAADAYENLQAQRFKMMRDSGVAGYSDITPDPLHIPHHWDGITLSRVGQARGKEFVISLLKKAILSGDEFDRASKYAKLGDKLTDAFKDRTATNMAKAIYNRFTRRPDTVNMARAGYLTKKDLSELRRRAEDIITNAADLKHLMAATDGKDSRLVNELLGQIAMDINTEIDGVAVRNFINTDLGSHIDTEIRRTAGKSAMADMGFADQSDFLEFTENAGRWYRENTQMDARQLETANTKNQKIWNLVMGENLERLADASTANFARGFRKAATLASLNQVGFAQTAEFGRLIGSIGIKGMIKQIPDFRNMIRQMRKGTFKDPILNDIEAAFEVRIGDGEILNHPSLLAESGGLSITKADQQSFMSGMDTVANKMLHVQGYLNGMTGIMKIQQRMHARGFAMRLFEDLAKQEIPGSRLKRYADIGLSTDDLDLVRKNIKAHAETTTGWFGQTRLSNMNLVKFDAGIREKLALAMHKNQAQAIQRNLGGETAWWMENTLGKLLTQFRTFPLVAIEKQAIHDMKHLDIEAFQTAVTGMGFAALAYTTKTYANSFGLPAKKRKQYLKNRLSPEKIFAGAASWSGQAAIAPDVLSLMGDFGFDNPFTWTHQKGMAYRDSYREQGLDLSAMGAVGGMADAAYKMATGLGSSIIDSNGLRKSTFKHGVRIMPFGNNIALKVGANYFLE